MGVDFDTDPDLKCNVVLNFFSVLEDVILMLAVSFFAPQRRTMKKYRSKKADVSFAFDTDPDSDFDLNREKR